MVSSVVSRSVFGSVAAALVAAPVVARGPAWAWVSSSVRGARLALRLLALGSPSPYAAPSAFAARAADLRLCFAAARRAGVPAARLAVLARVGRLVAAAGVPCPLASGAGVPASCLGVPASGFRPSALGVVVRDWSVVGGVLSVFVSGRPLPLLCLSSGLGGAAFDSLVDALEVARLSGVAVDLWAAPGRSGRVASPRLGASGWFCAVSV